MTMKVLSSLGLAGNLIAVFIIALLLCIALYSVVIAIEHYKYRHLPTPPYDSFFFGHLTVLRKYSKKGNYAGQQLTQWAEEYGPVYTIFLMHRCMVIVTGPSSVKELLSKSKYPKNKVNYQRMQSLMGSRFLGNGLLSTTDHEQWYKRRNALNPAFHKKFLTLSLGKFNAVGDAWTDSLNTVADGRTMFSMHESLCRVTSDAISEVGFDDHDSSLTNKDNRFLVAILNCLRANSLSSKYELASYSPSYRQTVRDSVQLIRSHGQKLMDSRMELIKRGEVISEDFLTYILKCKELDPLLSDEDLLDDFVTLFMAGQETTSNALAFMLCEVGRRPDILRKIQDEIDEVLGPRTDVDFEDLGRLVYCDQVFKEVLRLYAVAPGTSRLNNEEIILDGHRIPAGSNLLCYFFAIHRLSSHYDDPEDFRPERFSAAESRLQVAIFDLSLILTSDGMCTSVVVLLDPGNMGIGVGLSLLSTLYTYMPFSMGLRSCIGQQFSKIEAKVLMVKFFKSFDFKLDLSQPIQIDETTTLRPRGGVMMTLSRRN